MKGGRKQGGVSCEKRMKQELNFLTNSLLTENTTNDLETVGLSSQLSPCMLNFIKPTILPVQAQVNTASENLPSACYCRNSPERAASVSPPPVNPDEPTTPSSPGRTRDGKNPQR